MRTLFPYSKYEVYRQEAVRVPMRDGISLVGDLYLPARNGKPLPGPWPSLLERTPYCRGADLFVKGARFFARRGYAVLIQDVRGRYDSPGEFSPFGPGEVPDGHDTVVWMGEQPWCTGKVGTIGTSYMGCVQASLAMARPPHLAAQFIMQGFANHYEGRLRQGGAARLDIGLIWALRLACTSHEAKARPAVMQTLLKAEQNVTQWLEQVPLRKGQSPLQLVPVLEEYVLDVTTRGQYDEFWQQPGRDATAAWDTFPDVPLVLLGSWYDSHSVSTLEAYTELYRRQRTAPLRLIMGPWVHGTPAPDVPYAGEAHFGHEAILEYDDVRLAFFDQVLKGEATEFAQMAPVRIFVMGGGDGRRLLDDVDVAARINHGGRWRDEQEWPLARTRYTPLYLRSGGELSQAVPENGPPSMYRYDPNNPVPTVGGQISSTYGSRMSAGGFDQRHRPELGHKNDFPLAARPDVLVFETDPLESGVELTGPIEAVLYVSSSAPDTDFTAKLIDVYPPSPDYPEGFALNLTDGIMRARYRNGLNTPEFMEPGHVYEVRISLPAISNYFAPGNRIRIDLSSSNFPRFDRNFNTDEPVGRSRRSQIAENAIHHSSQYRSHVVLPVIPTDPTTI